ncbi:MAG: endo alpha-1,4 polygalactosaminidase, partial [Spirochaetaceae bacterium]|nr:endo alpha-1,4 polygalactosaminidase [Spirochaetaceae bacterium]MDT8297808.1 endo alpha-1,4 polygalactosaminidase [Spirochaetaceae bacterium]
MNYRSRRSIRSYLLVFVVMACRGLPLYAEGSVWNHAYQENWDADGIQDILENARNDYVLLDAFDDLQARSAIPALKAAGNTLAIYISVGTGEDWREDFDALRPSLVERPWGAWPGEYFIDHVDDTVMDVMKARIDAAAAWGADFIEFDNMDWASDSRARRRYKFHVTEEESLRYVNALRDYAEERGVLCMAKNMREGVEDFAGVTYESWSDEADWWDSADLMKFLAEGKLCIIFHYGEKNPAEATALYRERYGENLRVLVESRGMRGYVH